MAHSHLDDTVVIMKAFPRMTALALAILLTGFTGCDPGDDLPGVSDDMVLEGIELEPVESADQRAMRLAIEQARKDAGLLVEAIQTPSDRPREIVVRAYVEDAQTGRAEQVSLRDVTYADGKFAGTIDVISTVKPGQPHVVSRDELIDWYIIEGRRITGGYTLRVMRNRMTPESRRAFDDEMGVNFDD
jgi:uncharacterized protein YegJ (DUF2314 family)